MLQQLRYELTTFGMSQVGVAACWRLSSLARHRVPDLCPVLSRPTTFFNLVAPTFFSHRSVLLFTLPALHKQCHMKKKQKQNRLGMGSQVREDGGGESG